MINRRGRDGTVYWRCTRSRNGHCTGTLTTGPDEDLVSIKNTHNHSPDPAETEVKKIISSLKERTPTDIRPVTMLYWEEIHKVAAAPNHDEIAAKLPTLVSVKSSLYRHRRKLLPTLPTTREEVHFEGEWAETVGGERFLLAEEGGDLCHFGKPQALGGSRNHLCRWHVPDLPWSLLPSVYHPHLTQRTALSHGLLPTS